MCKVGDREFAITAHGWGALVQLRNHRHRLPLAQRQPQGRKDGPQLLHAQHAWGLMAVGVRVHQPHQVDVARGGGLRSHRQRRTHGTAQPLASRGLERHLVPLHRFGY
jgi:hypothetical protein